MGVDKQMDCRVGCGACCIAPSISSAIPGMPDGKPAGVRCIHLTRGNRCKLFGKPERPAVCNDLRPSEEMCGHSAQEAFVRLTFLERATKP
jgi:uncharacterized protein